MAAKPQRSLGISSGAQHNPIGVFSEVVGKHIHKTYDTNKLKMGIPLKVAHRYPIFLCSLDVKI